MTTIQSSGIRSIFACAAAVAAAFASPPAGPLVEWGAGTTNTGASNVEFGQCIVPGDLGDCQAVCAGSYHTLALQASGVVRAWGAGTTNQLYGGPTNIEHGQSIVPSNLGACQAIACGGYHNVVIKLDGTVTAWGLEATPVGSWPNMGQAVVPGGLGTCKAASAGYFHSVVIKDNGMLASWGAGATNTGWPDFGQRMAPANLGACKALACGGYHTAVIKEDGSVAVWGAGATNTGAWPNFGQSMVPANLGACKAIAAGDSHVAAIREDGSVVCWGAGTMIKPNGGPSGIEWGQCIVPANLGSCKAIAASGYHTVALREDGTVVCWGAGTTNSGYPNFGQCQPPGTLGACTAVGAGAYHSIAILAKPPCVGDLDESGEVDSADLGLMLLYYGPCDGCPADLDGSGEVDSGDLGLLLLYYGPCP
jgi:alpha-tubulin suppressor-like RCC1 family protein